MALLENLLYQHPFYRRYASRWHLLSNLSLGGYHVSPMIKGLILANPTSRPLQVIERRVKVAPFNPVMGTIITEIESQITKDEGSYIGGSNDDFWAGFFKTGYAATDGRKSFHQFLRDAMFNALTQGMAISIIDLHDEESTEPYLLLKNRWNLLHWKVENNGLTFAKFWEYFEVKDWNKPLDRYHEFLVYKTEERGNITASKYRVRLIDDNLDKPFSLRDLETYKSDDISIEIVHEEIDIFHLNSGLYKFPVVLMKLPDPLWISDQLLDLQKSNFNAGASGRWALASTNYKQLIFTGVDQQGLEFNNNPARWSPGGDGYFWEFPTGMDAKWLEGSTEGIRIAFDREEKDKQEMFERIRTISQVAANKFSQQSGESKKEDRRKLDILLEVYGHALRDFAEKNLEVAAIARGTKIDWTVEGFSDYDSENLSDTLEEYLLLEKANIDSPTLQQETQKGIATKATSELGLNQDKLEVIIQELEEDKPYHLDSEEKAMIERIFASGQMSIEGLLMILQAAGILPPDFDIEAEIKRVNGEKNDESEDDEEDKETTENSPEIQGNEEEEVES